MHIFIFKATITTDTVELSFHQRNYNVSQHLHYKLVVFIESLVSRRAQGFFPDGFTLLREKHSTVLRQEG